MLSNSSIVCLVSFFVVLFVLFFFFRKKCYLPTSIPSVMAGFNKNNIYQGTKIFQYSTWPAERVTYNFHWSCKHKHLMSFKSVCIKEHKGVIWLHKVILPQHSSCRRSALGRSTRPYLISPVITSHKWNFVPCIFLHKDKKIWDFVRTHIIHVFIPKLPYVTCTLVVLELMHIDIKWHQC